MIKKHAIIQSKLYKLYSKSELAKLLGCSTNFIKKFNPSRLYYHNRYEDKKNGKGKREINNPGRNLKSLHKTLLKIFQKIETPKYLMSGVKGVSIKDIATMHQQCNYMLCLDISDFYRSARVSYVRKMFIKEFKIASNLAEFLSLVTTIPSEDSRIKYIPTGSPISQMLIFWSYKQTFDDIEKEAQKLDIKFSLYVDDMTFSSESVISESFYRLVIKRLKSVGLTVKPQKTKRYDFTQDKTTVGIKITKTHETKITDKNRHNIISVMKSSGRISKWSLQIMRKVRGMIVSAQQKEPDFMMATRKRLDAEIRKQPTKKHRVNRVKKTSNKIKITRLPKFER